MSVLSFLVAYDSTLESVQNLEPSLSIFANDLGLCNTCVDLTNSCYACLKTNEQVFSNQELTTPVVDGYYMLPYENGLKATWHIVGGYPQNEGFYN